ncbi:hypothetical protein Fcan01_00448 [Folsomia candida]|uniref:Uncharacterized protein n=1 Tax=Folsomia candida TaxID=158441 RepID=A0A226EXC2_FOLCA|nr:hypothetical protein Fcan01_00448 [Folsomia candida]
MLQALEEYSKWMQHFTSPPIKWCPKKTKFVFSIRTFKNFLWFFHTFVGIGFCTTGGVVVILLSQFFQFYPPLPLAYVFLLGIELATCGAAFAICKLWNDFVREGVGHGLEYVVRDAG